jgi:hypothetical protein
VYATRSRQEMRMPLKGKGFITMSQDVDVAPEDEWTA